MLKNVNIIVILSEEFQAQIIKSQSSISKPFSYNESLHLVKLYISIPSPLKFSPFTEIERRESG